MSTHRTVIEAGTAEQRYWRDLWGYRGLFWFLAWRDILVRYKQTTIGVVWALLRPLLTLGAMALIGWLFGTTVPGNVPRLLLVGAATLPWMFFSTAFSEASGSLVANSNLLTKVYFPRLIVPASTVIVCAIDFLISLAIVAVLMVVYRFNPGWTALLLPVPMLVALVTALGSGLYIAALNVRFRDFRYVIPFIVQFGLYVSPVAFSSADIYANPRVPEWAQWIYSLNPMVAVIDGFRWCLLGGTGVVFNAGFYLSLGISGLLLVLGVRTFRRMETILR